MESRPRLKLGVPDEIFAFAAFIKAQKSPAPKVVHVRVGVAVKRRVDKVRDIAPPIL